MKMGNNNHQQQSPFTYYLVIVADRQKGKYFIWYDGTFVDPGEEVYDSQVHQKVKANDGRPGRVDRHIREQVERHLRYVGKKAFEYTQHQPIFITGVIIGGHSELISSIKNNLPQQLADNIIGEFITSTDLCLMDLIEKAKQTISKKTVEK